MILLAQLYKYALDFFTIYQFFCKMYTKLNWPQGSGALYLTEVGQEPKDLHQCRTFLMQWHVLRFQVFLAWGLTTFIFLPLKRQQVAFFFNNLTCRTKH